MKLSEQYVKSLAKETRDTIDGPYSARLTGYGMYTLSRALCVITIRSIEVPVFFLKK